MLFMHRIHMQIYICHQEITVKKILNLLFNFNNASEKNGTNAEHVDYSASNFTNSFLVGALCQTFYVPIKKKTKISSQTPSKLINLLLK